MQQEKALESGVQLKYTLNPSRIGTILGVLSLYIAAQSLFNEYLVEKVLNSDANAAAIALLDLFSVNAESSIPTWYSVLLLCIAALLLGAITQAKWRHGDQFKYYWAGLAIAFVYLSIDEGAAIHEIASDPLQALFHSTGYLAFGWVIIAVPLAILLALLYIPFLLHLSPRWRSLLIASGLIYVTGSLLFEAIGANRWYLDNGITFPYLAIGTVEELFEMLGVVLFIYTLLAYMAGSQQPFSLTFTTSTDQGNLPAGISPTQPPNPSRSRHQKWLGAALFCLILIINGAIFLGAKRSQTDQASSVLESVPFYRQVIDEYAGQGVVVLRINGIFLPGDPVTEQAAASLLVLFNDVTVVSLPQDQYSVAFASSTLLPFNKDHLRAVLLANPQGDFSIFDLQEIKMFAQGQNP